MKRILLVLAASVAFLLPVSADASPAGGHHTHSLSSHSNIDWD